MTDPDSFPIIAFANGPHQRVQRTDRLTLIYLDRGQASRLLAYLQDNLDRFPEALPDAI